MDFIKRARQALKVQLNTLLDMLEDPKKLREQEKIDRAEKKRETKKAWVQVSALCKQAANRINQIHQKMLTLVEKTKEAVHGGKDEEARALLEKKYTLERVLGQEEENLRDLNVELEKLKLAMNDTSPPALDVRFELDNDDRFSSIVDKIENLEYQNAALDEINGLEDIETPASSRLQNRGVKEALEQLKERMVKQEDQHSLDAKSAQIERELRSIKNKLGR